MTADRDFPLLLQPYFGLKPDFRTDSPFPSPGPGAIILFVLSVPVFRSSGFFFFFGSFLAFLAPGFSFFDLVTLISLAPRRYGTYGSDSTITAI